MIKHPRKEFHIDDIVRNKQKKKVGRVRVLDSFLTSCIVTYENGLEEWVWNDSLMLISRKAKR